MVVKPNIKEFYHKGTGTFSYVVFVHGQENCVIIDPVWDYDFASQKLSEDSFNLVCGFLIKNKLKPEYILETHIHADHVSSGNLFRQKFNSKIAISDAVSAVKSAFKQNKEISGGKDFVNTDFDLYFKDGDKLSVGQLNIEILAAPGHTPACACIVINNDYIFTGDVIFMPDFGTGRCDFPGGSAQQLFSSVSDKLYSREDDVQLFVGHDYGPGGRDIRFKSTIGEQKKLNKHIKTDTNLDEFVAMREARDATLNPPKLLAVSMKYNLSLIHI